MWNRVELKERGKLALQNNYWNSVLVSWVLGIASNATGLLGIFVFRPLSVGCSRFYLNNSDGYGDLSDLGYGFQGNYLNVTLTMFLTDLFVALWSLLFIIPGVIKAYSWRMVPYILAENPDIAPGEARALSAEMMDGNKWDSFVLDLSFIGWAILTGLSFGLVGLFWMNPYVAATDAELYKAVSGAKPSGRWDAFENREAPPYGDNWG